MDAVTEEKPDSRPKCGYKIPAEGVAGGKPCGSEERLYQVSGRGTFGAPKETPVCPQHIDKAYKEWNVDSYRPLEPTSHKIIG